MREQEMWQIVRSILGTTVRKVVLPASVGLGLALGGAACDHRVPVQTLDQGGDGVVEHLDGGAVARYAAPQADSAPTPRPSPDAGLTRPAYAAPFPDSGNTAGKYGAPFFDAG